MATSFDSEIGMWVSGDAEDGDEHLAREAESLHIHYRAAAVAQAVADEVAAIQYDRLGGEGPGDWVAKGGELLREISSLSESTGSTRRLTRRRVVWHEEGVDVMSAPWGLLLSTNMPLGVDWKPEDMMRLRSCCYSLRGSKSTAQFYLEILSHLGVHLRYAPSIFEPCFFSDPA